jgi:hypothetical protein
VHGTDTVPGMSSYPPAAPGLVDRPDLARRLDEAGARRVVSVSAPPGYGKWAAGLRDEARYVELMAEIDVPAEPFPL